VLRWRPREGKKILVNETAIEWEDALRLDEIALMLLRLNHVASFIVNADHYVM
jgi:hypothetical protein